MMLVFTEVLSELIIEAKELAEKDVLAMVQAAKQIQTNIFDKDEYHFHGSFPLDCQILSVPWFLVNIVSILLNGSYMSGQNSK